MLESPFEKRYAKTRSEVFADVKGRVLEVGCGSSSVLAVDNSEKMLTLARKRARKQENIEVKQMNAADLQLPDNSKDHVIATFVLCTIEPELQKKAFDEMVRVAKLGSRLIFFDETYPRNALRKIYTKCTSFISRFLYNLQFDSTMPLIEKDSRLLVEKDEYFYKDVLKVIVARKVAKR